MKAVVLAVALFGCWHFSGADETPPVESRGLSDARRNARGRADAGVADAEAGDGVGDETGVQSTGGSLGGPAGPGRLGVRKGRPGAGWQRAPGDAGVAAAPVDAGVMAMPAGCVGGRVIGIVIQGSEMLLTVATGSGLGITRSWTVTLPSQPQASARIVRVDKVITVIKVVRAALDDIRAGRTVVLCP